MKKKIQSRLKSALRSAPPPNFVPPRPAAFSNSRRADRAAGFKRAKLHASGVTPIDCVAVNCDRFGVRLRFAGAVAPPALATVVIPELALRRRARLCWVRGADAGFEYLDA